MTSTRDKGEWSAPRSDRFTTDGRLGGPQSNCEGSGGMRRTLAAPAAMLTYSVQAMNISKDKTTNAARGQPSSQ